MMAQILKVVSKQAGATSHLPFLLSKQQYVVLGTIEKGRICDEVNYQHDVSWVQLLVICVAYANS